MKVLIIEDDRIWQIKIEEMLSYILEVKEFQIASTVEHATLKIGVFKPDMIICDVFLDKTNTLNELQQYLKQIPTIIITSSDDRNIFKMASFFDDAVFMVKPFHKFSFISAVKKLNKRMILPYQEKFLKCNTGKSKEIRASEIVYIKAEGNYSIIVTKDKKKVAKKKSLVKMRTELNLNFIRIHKSYLVNIIFINQFDFPKAQVDMGFVHLPIGKTYIQSLMKM